MSAYDGLGDYRKAAITAAERVPAEDLLDVLTMLGLTPAQIAAIHEEDLAHQAALRGGSNPDRHARRPGVRQGVVPKRSARYGG